MYHYHKDWLEKWQKLFLRLRDSPQTFKVRELILKVRLHIQVIESRMLAYKWYGDNAQD